MTIVRYDSSPDMAALQQGLSRILGGVYRGPQEDLNRGRWVPVVDIYTNGQHELVLRAELPDMSEDEMELTVEDNTLTVSGEQKTDSEVTEQLSTRSQSLRHGVRQEACRDNPALQSRSLVERGV